MSTWLPLMRSPVEEWLTREVDVAGWLTDQGAPVVSPSRELPPGPHRHDGFVVSFWSYLNADPEHEVSNADCAAMLVDLHAALRPYPGELPVLPQVANDLPLGLAALDRCPDPLTATEADKLRARAEELRPLWEAPGELRPVHGDAHPGNLVATPDGLIWIDFEDICLGPREWDLALLHWQDPDAVAKHHSPDPELLARCSELRAVYLALCLVGFREVFGDMPDCDTGIRYFANALGLG
ncbi:MAG TPA: aminoglycoside phosphotransferase family protein [Pseudonocardia sp.]|uniref:aminoglycoside phosphotransferase family protein n=1 Tax=Pseudonocardia sp. TaxID=60912 RepID=UPI002D0E0E1C|nr:aminoglycoside phosphotransferase family protein [Pseudonocardia sp.]HTF48042.1 aminoglycoside phosphotransferase family protein [Pseudonocardia sp.]